MKNMILPWLFLVVGIAVNVIFICQANGLLEVWSVETWVLWLAIFLVAEIVILRNNL